MKIALAVFDLTASGGTQRQVLELARYLSERHQVDLYAYAFDPKSCYPELNQGLNVKSVGTQLPKKQPRHHGGLGHRLYFDFYDQFHPIDREERSFAELIEAEYDVLNIHDYHTERLASRYKSRFPNSQVIWMINDMPNTFQMLRSPRPKLRKHLPVYVGQLGRWLVVRWHARGELKLIRRSVDKIVALGQKNQRMIKQFMDLPSVAVASGLDIQKFEPVYQKPAGTFTVLAVGILFPERRYEILIQAIGLLKQRGQAVQLKIVGSDHYSPSYADQLKQMANDLGLDQAIQLLGKVSEEELIELYQTSHVFVLCSESQTWGLAPFEALSAGTPVIIPRQAGAADLLVDQQTALILESVSAEALADQIDRLIKRPELGQYLAKSGRRFVAENISWDKYGQIMEKIFNEKSSS